MFDGNKTHICAKKGLNFVTFLHQLLNHPNSRHGTYNTERTTEQYLVNEVKILGFFFSSTDDTMENSHAVRILSQRLRE